MELQLRLLGPQVVRATVLVEVPKPTEDN
jgi:hypothetical protein